LTALAILFVAGALATGLSGCGSSNSLGPGANTTSNYRVFNGLVVPSNTTGQAINFTLRTTTSTATAVSPYAVNPNASYINTPAGNGVNAYAFETGAPSPTISSSFDLQPNNYYTVLVIGTYQTNNTATAGQIVRLTDIPPTGALQNNAGTPLQESAIRIFNGAPNIPNIYVSNDTIAGNTTDIPGFDNIPYGHDSSINTTGLSNGYLVLPANGSTSYTFTVRSGSYTGAQLIQIPNFVPQAGIAYTIVITGSALSSDNVPLKYVVITDPLH
jgi:hypothetical protein